MTQETAAEEKTKSRFGKWVAVLMAVIALWGGTVGFLAADASTRESQATRDSEALAIELMATLGETGARTSHDIQLMADWIALGQQGIVDQAVALALQGTACDELIQRYILDTQVREKQAQSLVPDCLLLSDPRYAHSLEKMDFDMLRYTTDQMQPVLALLERQNAAADQAEHWGGRSNAYTSALTLVGVALFFLGLCLVLERGPRFLFLGLGLLIALADVGWTLVILFS